MSPFSILMELKLMEVVRGDSWNYKRCKATTFPGKSG